MRTLFPGLAAFALVALTFGCDGEPTATPIAPDPKPKAPEPEPEPVADPDGSDLKSALLGEPKDEETEAEEAPEPKPEPEDATAKRTSKRRASRKKAAEDAPKPDPREIIPSAQLPGAMAQRPAQLSDAQFEGVVGDWRGVKTCVATESARGGGSGSGALSVEFTIQGDGEVSGARVVDASSAFARALGPCVERKAMRLRFPDFGGKEPVRRNAKFLF